MSGGPAVESPMMQQYQRLKSEAVAEVGDAILFFRLGDFYEMFHDDAVRAARALDITLTARGRDERGEGGHAMCGVPVHAADVHVARLVRQGFAVAIADQVEDPRQARGVVRREIVRIVTPGTATDPRSLTPEEGSFVTAVLLAQGRVGLAHADVSTGELRFSEHDLGRERDAVQAEVGAFAPREILVPGGSDRAAILTLLPAGAQPAWCEVDAGEFARSQALAAITSRFHVAGVAAFGLDARPAATRAVGALLAYLDRVLRAEAGHLEPPRLVDPRATVLLDPTTRRNLELVENLRDGGRQATLLSVLDRTATAMGARALRASLVAPLRDVAAIDRRLDAVAALKDDAAVAGRLDGLLRRVADIERLSARAALGQAGPRDLALLAGSLAVLPDLRGETASLPADLLASLATDIDPLTDLQAELARALAPEPPAVLRDGGAIRESHSRELDELRALARDARAHLSAIEARERGRTGIGSLKVRHNRVFGYYLEVSRPNLDKVPADYERRQTLAGAERFATPELKELEARILGAVERSLELEGELFEALRQQVAAASGRLRASARALAALDVLAALAAVARSGGWVRPEVDDSLALRIIGGRHPVVERLRGGDGEAGADRFVPNDTDLDGAVRQLVILTGPNMGGKSTYLRQVALIALLAQVGAFVPAESARIGVVDQVFARVGASDSLATGQSTFMVEMQETARILNSATRHSLVILDEVGRGTATFDGLSIAWAVAEHLLESPRVAARTLFATHYHELTELALVHPRAHNLRLATREWNGEIVFLHRVETGVGDRSYGIQVARLAGLPATVVARAREILDNLERGDLDPMGRPKLAARRTAVADGGAAVAQMTLFATAPDGASDPRLQPLTRLAEEIAGTDADALAPRAALDLLADLAARARALLS